ncbi:branched-chain amino acid aminotransferase [Ilyonectria robusta]
MSPSATSLQDVSSTAKRAEYGDFNVEKMTYTLVPEAEQQPVPGLQHPGRMTQKLTTAHMVLCKWDQEEGWAAPEMMPYGKISLEPTASVLHYATESFVSPGTAIQLAPA